MYLTKRTKKLVFAGAGAAAVAVIALLLVVFVWMPKDKADKEFEPYRELFQSYSAETLDFTKYDDAIATLEKSGALSKMSSENRALVEKVQADIKENREAKTTYDSIVELGKKGKASCVALKNEEAQTSFFANFDRLMDSIPKDSRFYAPAKALRDELAALAPGMPEKYNALSEARRDYVLSHAGKQALTKWATYDTVLDVSITSSFDDESHGPCATIEGKIIIHMADNYGAGGVTGYMKYTAKFYNESTTGKIDIYGFSAKDDK